MSLEDFTTYTELDANNRYTVTTNKIAVNRIEIDDVDQYVVSDKGVAFFDGNFTHQFKATITENTGGFIYPWCLSNVLDEIVPMTDALWLRWANATQIVLAEEVGGNLNFDVTNAVSISTPYYFTIIRDENIGSFGQLQCLIYDDVDRTSLIDTLTVVLRSKVDWRYIYGTAGAASGGTQYSSADIENLDLGLVAGFQAAWARNSNQIIEVNQ